MYAFIVMSFYLKIEFYADFNPKIGFLSEVKDMGLGGLELRRLP
jgi:hypothetical protein